MQDRVETTPSAVFQTLNVLHLSFMASTVIYFVVAEIMRVVVDDFAGKGFNDMGSGLAWSLRAALLAVALVIMALTRTVLGDESTVPRMLKSQPAIDDTALAGALQSAHILRVAASEAIGIMGLVLYMQTGDRIDYAFIALSFIGLLALRPSRDHWNEVFRRFSVEHPGVSSSLSPTG